MDKVTSLENTVKETQDALKKFDGVNLEETNKQMEELKQELANKDADYQKQIADRDFNDLLKDSISSAKGINSKAIAALLEIDELKASKNQKEDIASAIKVLTEAEDSKMLFGEPDANPVANANTIGDVGGGNNLTQEQKDEATMMAAMRLKPEGENK